MCCGKKIQISSHLANLIKQPIVKRYPLRSFSYRENGELKFAKISDVKSIG